MLSVYILCLVIFPLAVFYKTTIQDVDNTYTLIQKGDTNFLRGAAACCVLISHHCTWLKELQNMNAPFYIFVSQLGGIGVLIFFFVSGYGINESCIGKRPGFAFMWKRAKGVYLPYLLIKASFFTAFLIGGEPQKMGTDRLLSVLSAEEDWFIHVILIQYLIYFFLKRFAGSNMLLIAFSLLADALMSIVFAIEGRPEGWYNALWLFTFGIICSQYKKQIICFFDAGTRKKIMLSLLAFGITGACFAVFKGAMWANIAKPVSGMALCFALCGLFRKVMFLSPAMAYFGKRSLHLYIVHSAVWAPLRVTGNAVARFWLSLILSVFITEIMYRMTRFLLQDRTQQQLQ